MGVLITKKNIRISLANELNSLKDVFELSF